MTIQRQDFTWGDTLVVAAFRSSGGLNPAVRRIHDVIGDHIGVRNTFAKLQHVRDVDDLADRDQFRAWLLLTALGRDAREFGLRDDAVPLGYDVEQLRDLLPRLDSNQRPFGLRSLQVRARADFGLAA